MNDPRDKLSKDFLEVARELVEAAKHAEIASTHFANNDIPRACAHSTATQGHIHAAETLIREFQLTHRKFARTEP